MRRIFRSLPYFLPPDPEPVAALFSNGRKRRIPKGGTLKAGGMEPRVFLLTSGQCAYYAGEGFGRRPTILSTILPGRIMGDMTAAVGTRCNVHTVALEPSEVIELNPAYFQRTIANDPSLATLQLKNITAKEESLIEGMVANFMRPPEERLLIYMKALLLMTAGRPSNGTFPTVIDWTRVEIFVPALDSNTSAAQAQVRLAALKGLPSAERLGEALNLNRVSVARIIAGWLRLGRAVRRNRKLFVDPTLFDGIDDWMNAATPLSATAE